MGLKRKTNAIIFACELEEFEIMQYLVYVGADISCIELKSVIFTHA